MANLNEMLYTELINFRKLNSIKIGYVDIVSEGGELLKETFDIETLPSIRLVKPDGKVYHLKWMKQIGLWTAKVMQNFVEVDHADASYDFKRARVSDGIMLKVEYIANFLAETHFSWIMEHYLAAKKVMFEYTGVKHDLKSMNPNMGKKNTFKKS